MPTTDKTFKGGLPELTLVGAITASVPGVGGTIDTSGTATNWPTGASSHSFVIVIGSEAILVSTRSGNQFTVEQRGYDNTTAASHANNDVVTHELDAATILAHEQHIAKTADAHTAAAITNVAAGNIAATTVQAAINELDTEKAGLASPTFTGTVNAAAVTLSGLLTTAAIAMADNELRRSKLLDYSEVVEAVGNSGTSKTLDIELGNVKTLTLTGNCTLTLSNPSPTGNACSLTLIITQDATGSRTISWPASVKWAAGVAPTLTTTASKTDIITLFTPDAGTTWYGFLGGKAFA